MPRDWLGIHPRRAEVLNLGHYPPPLNPAPAEGAPCQGRHMTKGQRAMAVAMIYPDPEKCGRGKKSQAKTSAKIGGFSMDIVDKARTVLEHASGVATARSRLRGHLGVIRPEIAPGGPAQAPRGPSWAAWLKDSR